MGLASGMAPRAHIAVYRVCTEERCEEPDILRAIEEAVKDGCDVLSISLGDAIKPFYNDPISIAGFTASHMGVFVSTSAGNDGPLPYTLSNDAPWLLTVAASTISRRFFYSTIKLGNGLQLNGESKYQPNSWVPKMFPLVYLGKVSNIKSGQCLNGTLDQKQVNGKIVICDRGGSTRLGKGLEVRNAGGVGMILVNSKKDGYDTIPDKHVLPASNINYFDGEKLKKYIRSTKDPVATLVFKGVVMDNMRSHSIANFSSRGPSRRNAFILKPDIAGPGVNILAAVPPTKVEGEISHFAIKSGTSMACYSDDKIGVIIQPLPPVKCAKTKAIPQEQLNYPSIVVPLSTGNAVIYRTVTNVGDEKDSYKAKIKVPKGVSATVIPDTLNFTRVYEKKTFKIVFKWVGGSKANGFGDLKLISKRHVVRSPIVLQLAAQTLA
ncbi:Subtilisin-like serine protease [Rhynchospora pubera]|uniref:Subtilisin-like serine protease n=1 Tax=Rhynchospora pubera TaxID=906938 RepID=A0AAV8DB83_9POAL|nr:Subtilisin-like serine protease [Rhynchospora pubera]